MGNLLGTPVTDKETHSGRTDDLEFGLSSMQGWRVHMEDAHIAECNLYAMVQQPQSISSWLSSFTSKSVYTETATSSSSSTSSPHTIIELPGHSFFAIFDGHGGTFAAQYSGDNLCRVLSKQPMFVEYAKFYHESLTKTFATPAEKVQFMRSGIEYLEAALRQSFVELDCEIALAMRGTPHPDANTPYQRPGTTNSASADHAAAATSSTGTFQTTTTTTNTAAPPPPNVPDEDGDAGTTACCVLITPEWVVCANAGDSRAVFSKNSRAVPLSYDHKPDDEGEERRIRAAGGYVAGGRVEGDLAVSRGLGDFRFKHIPTVLANLDLKTGRPQYEVADPATLMKPGDQKVSPIPDIIWQTRNKEQDEFLIVACDGIWDVRTNQLCVAEVANMFQEGEMDLGVLCEELLDTCLRLGSKDNMTALVVKFQAQQVGSGGGVLARRKERGEHLEGEAEATSQPDDERWYSSGTTTTTFNGDQDNNATPHPDDEDNDGTQQQQPQDKKSEESQEDIHPTPIEL